LASIYQGRLGRALVIHESSFGTDMSGTLGSYADVPIVIDTLKIVRDEKIVQPGHIIQRLDQRDLGIPMPRIDTKLGFSVNIETFDTKGTDGVTPAQHHLGVMLESCLGGKYISTGALVSGGASTTTKVDIIDASGLRPGGALAVVNPAGRLEVREIASINTGTAPDEVTLKMALSFAPANGATVYGVATYFLHNNPLGADPKYAQFLIEGYHPKDRWMFPACALESLGFSGLEPSGLPRMEFNWQSPTWLPADGTNTVANLRASDLAQVAYTNVKLSTIRDADVRLRSIASSALPSFLQAPKITMTPAVRYEALRTPGAAC
jgi:hypothetical protein